MISLRTREGLAAAKRRGTILGTPDPKKALKACAEAKQAYSKVFTEHLEPIIKQIQKAGATSLRQIAFSLNAKGYETQHGREFKAQTLANLLRQVSG